jgi:hypothetical protein
VPRRYAEVRALHLPHRPCIEPDVRQQRLRVPARQMRSPLCQKYMCPVICSLASRRTSLQVTLCINLDKVVVDGRTCSRALEKGW